MVRVLNLKTVVCMACVAVVLFGVSGCKGGGRNTSVSTDLNGASSAETTDTRETTTGTGLPEIDQEQLLFPTDGSSSGLRGVYFDFDSSALRPDTLATLRENAGLIKQAPGVIIQIEGHCDERGTQEYNIALGERRALAVRGHLIKLGVGGDRLLTISYGEESPEIDEHNETAWSRNRRCEFNKEKSL